MQSGRVLFLRCSWLPVFCIAFCDAIRAASGHWRTSLLHTADCIAKISMKDLECIYSIYKDDRICSIHGTDHEFKMLRVCYCEANEEGFEFAPSL